MSRIWPYDIAEIHCLGHTYMKKLGCLSEIQIYVGVYFIW